MSMPQGVWLSSQSSNTQYNDIYVYIHGNSIIVIVDHADEHPPFYDSTHDTHAPARL
jgi:hypothetical protein